MVIKFSVIKNVILIILIALFSNIAAQAGLYNPKMFTLKNGLQVVVLENHRANIVTHSVWYKIGGADDPWSKSGLAHYLEHMMFNGPENSDSARYRQHLSRIGGFFNALTDADTTNYYATVASEYLESVVALEAARMQQLTVVDSQAENELKVVLQERNMRIENNPINRFMEILNARFIYNHPYRIPIIGWKHEILQLKADDVRQFHQQWYAPNNAYVIFAGDITTERAYQLAEQYYGSIPAKNLPTRRRLQEPPHHDTIETMQLQVADIKTPLLLRVYQAPNFKTEDGKHHFAIQVLHYILTNQSWGLLYKTLVEQQKLATHISLAHSIYTLDANFLMIIAQPTQNNLLKDLELAFDQAIIKILQNGITVDDLSRAKRQMVAATLFTQDNVAAAANDVGQKLAIGVSLSDIDNWVEAIQGVSIDQVMASAHDVFGKKHYLTAYLLPLGTAEQR